MAAVTGTSGSSSGSGYARASMSPWDAAGGAMPGGGSGLAASFGGLLDPNLLREAMLQGLEQRRVGFEEWKAGKEQARYLADQEELRKRETATEGKLARKRSQRIEDRNLSRREPAERVAQENAVSRDVAQTQALTGRVPTRMSTVGMQTFATPDALKMTGAQRMQFLPGAAAGLTSDAAFQSMIRGLR